MFNFSQSQPIVIVINGKAYTGFKSATVENSLEAVSGTFSFVATSTLTQIFPIKVGDSCQVQVNNTAVLTGFVEKVDVTYGAHDHTITISGRDRTCDLIDSSLGENLTFVAPIGIDDVARKVISYLGIDDIFVELDVDEVIEPFNSGEIMSAEIGETGFNFLEKYAQKRQILLTTDGLGNLILARSSSNVFNSVISSGTIGSGSVLTASVNLDYTKRFYKYIVHAQANAGGMGSKSKVIDDLGKLKQINQLPVSNEVHMHAEQIDDDQITPIRETRIHHFKSSTSELSQKKLQDRAKWEMNYRKSTSFTYNVTMQGFTAPQDGRVWRPNYLVTVIDSYCNINSQLLIKSVKFDYSIDGGSKTMLQLVDKDVFTLKLAKEAKEKKLKGSGGKGKVIESFDFLKRT